MPVSSAASAGTRMTALDPPYTATSSHSGSPAPATDHAASSAMSSSASHKTVEDGAQLAWRSRSPSPKSSACWGSPLCLDRLKKKMPQGRVQAKTRRVTPTTRDKTAIAMIRPCSDARSWDTFAWQFASVEQGAAIMTVVGVVPSTNLEPAGRYRLSRTGASNQQGWMISLIKTQTIECTREPEGQSVRGGQQWWRGRYLTTYKSKERPRVPAYRGTKGYVLLYYMKTSSKACCRPGEKAGGIKQRSKRMETIVLSPPQRQQYRIEDSRLRHRDNQQETRKHSVASAVTWALMCFRRDWDDTYLTKTGSMQVGTRKNGDLLRTLLEP